MEKSISGPLKLSYAQMSNNIKLKIEGTVWRDGDI